MKEPDTISLLETGFNDVRHKIALHYYEIVMSGVVVVTSRSGRLVH